MGTAVSKKKNLRNDAISSVAAKVRAARAFGEYLSHTHPENHSGSDHLLSDTITGQDKESSDISSLNNKISLQPYSHHTLMVKPFQENIPPVCQSAPLLTSSKRCLSVECSLSSEDQQHHRCVENSLKPARVYTITRERDMLGGLGSEESLELEVLKRTTEPPQANAPSNLHGSQHRGSHHCGNNGHIHQHHYGQAPVTQPFQSSRSTHNVRDWGSSRSRSREDCTPDCVACIRPHCQSQRSLDLDNSTHDSGKQHKKLERMYSEDHVPSEDRDDHANSWFPKENMFSFQTATTTMQANFRKHLRMVGSKRVKAHTFADRKTKSFSRSWSDPTPVKPDSLHDSRDSGDLQTLSGNLDEADCDDVDWEEEREMERAACEGDDFIPPKIMLISSKVPKAEYVPNIIRRNDPSIIPILYDHEHATFDDILEEIEKKLTAYRKGCKIWNMLIFCQGGPGHLYLLKNKVATFAKVEKEEDMIQFWRRLGKFMSLLNPEPNLIHVMGCYVLGNANGEKLFQNLKRLMKPHAIAFKSPLELSAQGKEMIEMYFDFRLYRLWKSRQHSKLLDYDDLL
ncbi:NMDA receptor synaptonuclear signaling and neuronal migration factor-like [Xyrauchen texanus]|uniref:NMDA receptor synaptonuclear signaling and neuronal migration factor-like n=1 Tax=Xyrauchen texanus TaxID=154827 RepID=UPI0022428285|nr:NMDA receptor synaptonuclear signaling and neuronal migration factor-like [Xyrauchen texanus]